MQYCVHVMKVEIALYHPIFMSSMDSTLSPSVIGPLHIYTTPTPWGAYRLALPIGTRNWSIYSAITAIIGTIVYFFDMTRLWNDICWTCSMLLNTYEKKIWLKHIPHLTGQCRFLAKVNYIKKMAHSTTPNEVILPWNPAFSLAERP